MIWLHGFYRGAYFHILFIFENKSDILKIRGGIIMKYKTKNSLLSLILFEKGSIIMSGAICYSDIIKTYKFINLILLDNYLKCKK